MEAMRCKECGALDCEALRDALLTRDYEQPVAFWRYHRMAVDAYCLQHDAYVASAKSLAAHLCGLCVAFEGEGNSGEGLRALQAWLSTNPRIQKPALPAHRRGELTVESVSGIEEPRAFGAGVERWARAVWEAYVELHPVAREWLAAAGRGRR